jgi:hypothetical protein
MLRAPPEAAFAEFGQLLDPLDDGRKVIPGQRPRLGGEGDVPVRQQELGLADAAGIEKELARFG